MSYPIPVETFGRYQWSPFICAGVEALSQLPPGRCLPLRYEDLLAAPAATLTAFCEFIEVDAPRSWLAAARPSSIQPAAERPPLSSIPPSCPPYEPLASQAPVP